MEMEYKFGTPEHHPAEAPAPNLYQHQFQEDLQLDAVGCMWQALGILLVGFVIAVVIAVSTSEPAQSAAPQPAPNPNTHLSL